MQIPKPSKLGIFQWLAACLFVALLTAPGDAHHGPMLIFKGGHGHGGGGGMGAASILAAGIVVKLLQQIKHKHHKGFSGGGFSGGGFSGGHGYSMGGGHGYEGMARDGMGHSFESHDAHLMNYGYEPQGFAWAK